jgi:hypothetical protein
LHTNNIQTDTVKLTSVDIGMVPTVDQDAFGSRISNGLSKNIGNVPEMNWPS